MVHFSLLNVKENNSLSNIKIFSPIKLDLANYIITIKSDILISIQFYLYIKLLKYINIKCNKMIYKYYKIPKDGFLLSCTISKENYIEISFEPKNINSQIYIFNFIKNTNFLDNYKNIHWDNIFIINLSRRNDRKEEMLKKIQEENIINYEFIDAIDGNTLSILETFQELKNNKKTKIITPGHYACLQSHLKAIKIAKSRNYSSIMILEDDVFFCKNFLSKLLNLKIPKYDMLYLGGIISNKKLFFNEWSICKNTMGAYGYILNSNLFDIIIEELEKGDIYVDVFYKQKIQKKYQTILLSDYIKTNLSSSDTSEKSLQFIKKFNYIT
jgi:GR25 family glycosyltransferase involved in LPS biosynthesis